MDKKTIFYKRLTSICLMFTIFLVSCASATSFSTKDNYLSLKYPDDMSFTNASVENIEAYSFFYNDENFVILATEDVSNIDPNVLNNETLKNNAIIFSEPFTSQGFSQTSEENITIGDNDAYLISYTNSTYVITYLQWFEENKDPATLYKIMYIYDTEHKDSIESIIKSIKINN